MGEEVEAIKGYKLSSLEEIFENKNKFLSEWNLFWLNHPESLSCDDRKKLTDFCISLQAHRILIERALEKCRENYVFWMNLHKEQGSYNPRGSKEKKALEPFHLQARI